jgi:hypothetical protein
MTFTSATQLACWASSAAPLTALTTMVAKIPSTTMTTSSSIIENPASLRLAPAAMV